ncbi:BnaA06g16400D [Brassica napus]|uniref:BnaA06g16400D protein n=1 Tax=Brassica napus TaxID=3708 RepID=A0A078F428_BRANA|nr:BnaA06g16400D [Brassica napus]
MFCLKPNQGKTKPQNQILFLRYSGEN